MTDSPLLVHALFGLASDGAVASDAGGGRAFVHGCEVLPDEADMAARAREHAAVSVFVAGAAGRYAVESFSPQGQRIRFCGHGALAAGWYLFNEREPQATRLECFNADRGWQAVRAESPEADVTLVYASPEQAACAVPDWAAECIGTEVLAAAESGGPEDYLLLEVAVPASVRSVVPAAEKICAATRRALLVTAAEEDRSGCVFRYFAPQYGDLEDAATGSAGVQLAPYWTRRLGRNRVCARQLSDEGAVMHLTCHAGMVELAARVRYG